MRGSHRIRFRAKVRVRDIWFRLVLEYGLGFRDRVRFRVRVKVRGVGFRV